MTWRARLWLIALGVVAGLLVAGSAGAQTAQQLRDAEQARAAQQAAKAEAEARTQAARAEEQRLAGEQAAAAARLRALEGDTVTAAERVAGLARRQREAEARLQQRTAEMAPVLPLMERLAVYPAETLLAVPLPPEQAVRGLLVLGMISRQIEADAATVRAGETEAERLRRATEAEMPALSAAEAAQARAAAALDAQIAQTRDKRRAAEDEASEAARRAASEAARADNIRAALARLEAEQRAAEQRARAEAAAAAQRARAEAAAAARNRDMAAAAAARERGQADAEAARRRQEALARPAGPGLSEGSTQLTAPVAGSVTRGWGEASDSGPATGVTYAVAPAARVVSPCTGRVVFANAFRSYGMLMIVDCGGGWHAVMAGLERFDLSAGEAVRAGEPVGVMPGWDPRAGGARPALYLELRKGGQPVNPAPFLHARG